MTEELLNELKGRLEAILMITSEPVTARQLAQYFDYSAEEITHVLIDLQKEYNGQLAEGQVRERGFELRQNQSGWRVYARSKYNDLLKNFYTEETNSQLSQAALETLAIIAYKQPMTRAQVAAVRGVNSDAVIKNLVSRQLVEENIETTATGAHIYTTSLLFLEKMGLENLDDLPHIAPLLPDIEKISGQIEGDFNEFFQD